MGKTTGFLEYGRALPIAYAPDKRVDNWSEFHGEFSDEQISTQAARCMNCGTPFCHVGEQRQGITTGCPIHNIIPEWNDLVYRGRWAEAWRVLSSTNNFPEFTGRVCPAPCESSCVLGINNDPVAIKEIELDIIEHAFRSGIVMPRIPTERTGKKVAIVGSGPAGLACADELNQAGHTVIVFEREDRIGGLLMYGIPNMKLDKGIVQRRIGLMAEEGIEFRTNTRIGIDITAEQLKNDFDAIVLCCGSTVPRDLPIEGRELNGIHFAMDFLTANTKHILASGVTVDAETTGRNATVSERANTNEDLINVQGKDVIVIGGGDTGTDCVGTAIRQGCRTVTQFEIMDRPPDKMTSPDAWLANVRTFQTDYGQEEAAAKFGRDPREFRVMTSKFFGDEKGNVNALETVEVEWKDGKPVPIKDSEKLWKADSILLAMGFIGPEKAAFFNDLGIELTPRGTIAVDANKSTNIPGIFAAGDCERGQSLVVWAIADGRRAADGVNGFF